MKKAELVILTLSLIALGLNLLLVPGSGVVAVVGISVLSVIYFYLGFAFFNNIRLRSIFKKESYKGVGTLRIVGALGAGFAISTTAIGILFKFQSWPGVEFTLGAGLAGLFIVTVIGLIKFAKNKSAFYTKIFKRVAIFGVLGILLLAIPAASWVELKYRNHPDYVEAYKKSLADPDNEELRNNLEAERQKMKQ